MEQVWRMYILVPMHAIQSKACSEDALHKHPHLNAYVKGFFATVDQRLKTNYDLQSLAIEGFPGCPKMDQRDALRRLLTTITKHTAIRLG